jgi:hypothetical protein
MPKYKLSRTIFQAAQRAESYTLLERSAFGLLEAAPVSLIAVRGIAIPGMSTVSSLNSRTTEDSAPREKARRMMRQRRAPTRHLGLE